LFKPLIKSAIQPALFCSSDDDDDDDELPPLAPSFFILIPSTPFHLEAVAIESSSSSFITDELSLSGPPLADEYPPYNPEPLAVDNAYNSSFL
jgi:hypothetical protein